MRLHLVPARTGLTWVQLGMKTFMRQPLAMAGLFFMFMAVVSVLSVLPLVGAPVALALVPAATLGLMAASREAQAGRFPMPVTLIVAFRAGPQRRRAMLTLGAMYAGALLGLMLLAALVGGTDGTPPPADPAQVTPEALRAALGGPAMWLVMLLYLPVMAAFWHAPALVHWHGVTPLKSLFFSAMACWANKGALLVFMASWLAVFMFGGLAVTLIGALFGGTGALQVIVYPFMLLLASLFHTSLYFTFRDSFETDEAAESSPGETT